MTKTKQPLTKKELRVFLKNFEAEFFERYEAVLESGEAMADYLTPGNHILAKMVIVAIGEDVRANFDVQLLMDYITLQGPYSAKILGGSPSK